MAAATKAANITPAQDGQVVDLEKIRTELAQKGLHAKIAWVQHNVLHVEKTGKVSFGNTSFSAMQEHGLIGVARALWRAAGLSVIGGCTDPGAFRKDGNQYFVDWALTVSDVDSDASIVRYYPNVGNDSNDKGLNKAMTAANKYALQKFFQIPTQEIDDNDASVITETIAATPAAQAVGATVHEMSSRKPSEEDIAKLTATLGSAVQDGHFDKPWVKNTLTAEFGVGKVADLDKRQFSAFSAIVAEKIAGPAPSPDAPAG